eukprot:COSAG02_NODE_5456_length_4302_cov_3.254818_3_plen_109_part_00
MAALIVTPACAVPTAPELTFEQSLSLSSPLSQHGYAAVENELSAILTKSNGAQTTATVVTQSANRRLQDSTMLSITYIVNCGATCDAVAAVSQNGATLTLATMGARLA